MNYERITKDAFCVIGKAGSTNDGEGFVQKLWKDANSHFDQVKDLAVCDESGTPLGFWGAMTNFAFEFKPWEDGFSKGLYLAGVEVRTDAVAPKGWKKWIVPGFEYIKVAVDVPGTFKETLAMMEREGIPLVGAVQDFTDPKTGKNYMLFPVAVNDSKEKLIQAVKKTVSPFAVCGLHCDFCFLTKWCGGCRSACNVCSFATECDDNICPNVACAKEKGVEGCYECDKIQECDTGFYASWNDGAYAIKALALYTHKHGKAETEVVLKKLHEKYDFQKLQDVLKGDCEEALRMLESCDAESSGQGDRKGSYK